MWGRYGVGSALAVMSAIADAATYSTTSTCPNIFYDAASVILRSPFLLSTDPAINFQCHSCIANLAAKQAVSPLCYIIGMDGYDPQYKLEQDCNCLSLGLTEECAPVCLPNPLCTKASASSACSACVAKNAPATCNRDEWNLSCYETCQQPVCITECSPSAQCHPADAICAKCVQAQSSTCDTSIVTFGRQWSASCTAGCYSSKCKSDCNRTCGDGIKTADEQCDDGNTSNGDGCSASCQIESSYVCTTADHALSQCHLTSCGDGRLEGTEACDDGNTANGDGCSNSCQIERGATCTTPTSTKPSVCKATCGDGVMAVGLEACDDGNTANGDGCSSTCRIENGYTCPTNTTKSTCNTTCGDGIVAGSEQCDDGNVASFDGCSATCTTEPGYTCSANENGLSQCKATCGDGIIAYPVEACDDGNRVAGDGCSFACQVEKGFTCSASNTNAKSTCTSICGDAIIAGAEACDDGNKLDNDGCSTTCAVETGWQCAKNAIKSICEPICGDGLVKGWEQCDDTTRNCVNCTKYAVPPPRCGDGYIDTGETCDDGNSVSGDGCSSNCQVESGYVCQDRVCHSVCGNGIKTSDEGCDDGNTANGDGCSANCRVEPAYSCSVASSGLSTCAPICGDGKIVTPETCDDGNTANGDGCSSTCRVESGFSCKALSTGVSSCQPVCGDGLVAGAEACDDSNTKSGDGCSSTCRVEPGYKCPGSGGVCTTVCGDGVRTANEACDDGNTASKDGCSSSCTIETGWNCNAAIGKTTSCTRVPTCGDGYVSPGEFCDDGNNNSGDGCSSRCITEALYTCAQDNPTSPSVCVKSNCQNVRKDWYQLTSSEKSTFQSCMSQLFQTSFYQKMTGIHVFNDNDQYAHHTNGFVSWHRKWLLMVQNMLRAMGGACSCINLPYWDWTEDAVAMQSSGCSSRTQCSGVLRDWGGGGTTHSKYATVPIYKDPVSGVASGSASGYCVLNDITKTWRAGMEIHRFKTAYDPTCPIIRRGWNDFNDANGQYATPLASSSFLNLASSLANAQTFADFIQVALGDIHVLPHDRSGGFMTTFISPADPIFLLHHTNIDRVYALWEACHGCTNPSRATRTREGKCYSGTGQGDGILDTMVFQCFDPVGNGQYQQIAIESSSDLAEFVPRSLNTPGDVMDTTSLGDYAYTYSTDDFDTKLFSLSGCVKSRPAMFMAYHVHGLALLDDSDVNIPDDDNVTYSLKIAREYLEWVDTLLNNVNQVVSQLQVSNVFAIPYLSKLQSAEAYASDILATCECMHMNQLLIARDGANHLTPSFLDVSPASKRAWNNSFPIRSCFHRLLDDTEKDKLLRQYCEVVLSPDFEAELENLLNDLVGLFSQNSAVSSTISQIWEYFTKS
ncbi:hypothetical protein AeRB84_017357 [Aphanomyces euteiches]|nr:hypothetical protein AeRB84_017357 [Aphanomyces euteiches]